MKVFITVILVLVCTISIFLFIRQRKQLRKMLDVLVKTRNGENKKIFVKDNGVI